MERDGNKLFLDWRRECNLYFGGFVADIELNFLWVLNIAGSMGCSDFKMSGSEQVNELYRVILIINLLMCKNKFSSIQFNANGNNSRLIFVV